MVQFSCMAQVDLEEKSKMAEEWQEEEQAMEAEALQAILTEEELHIIAITCPREYLIKLVPYPAGDGDNHVAVSVTFKVPPMYPEVGPDILVSGTKGLSVKQTDALRQLLMEKAVEGVGMPMIYTLVEVVREWLLEHNIPGQDGSMHAAMLKRMHIKEQEKKKEQEAATRSAAEADDSEEDALMRQKRLDGTPVTPETFAAWKAAFDTEMATLNGGSDKDKAVAALKPTGKEMFLRHLAGTAEPDVDDDSAGVEVAEGLFGDDDEVDDLEDSDDDEEYEGESDSEDDNDYDSGSAGGANVGNKGLAKNGKI